MTDMTTINANAIERAAGRFASSPVQLPATTIMKSRSGRASLGKCSAQVLAAVVGIMAVTKLAWCADLPPPVTPAPVVAPYSWSGLYIGLNAGYNSTKLAETANGGGLSGSGSTTVPGGIGGFQIGANYQMGAVVLGFEADFAGTMATKSTTIVGIASNTAQIPWIGTLRGRLGYAFDRVLLYATAGGAATQLISTVNVPPLAASSSTTFTHGAWTAGGGLEAAVTENLSARIEYLYVDTGNFSVAEIGGPPPTTFTGRIQSNLVRAGVNYRLPVAW
jgi:outer membrane immunogenic protein